MRIKSYQIETINQLAKIYFGSNTKVFLFGSRLDNKKKGGDIDILIKKDEKQKMNLRQKSRFLTELKMKIGFQKIDVIFDNEKLKLKTDFYNEVISSAQILQVDPSSFLS